MEKEYVASSRIYGLTKSLKEMDQNVTIYLPNLPIENGYNYDFIDKVNYYPVKESLFLNFLRECYKKNKKRKANNHNNSEKKDFIYESRMYSNIYKVLFQKVWVVKMKHEQMIK